MYIHTVNHNIYCTYIYTYIYNVVNYYMYVCNVCVFMNCLYCVVYIYIKSLNVVLCVYIYWVRTSTPFHLKSNILKHNIKQGIKWVRMLPRLPADSQLMASDS